MYFSIGGRPWWRHQAARDVKTNQKAVQYGRRMGRQHDADPPGSAALPGNTTNQNVPWLMELQEVNRQQNVPCDAMHM